MISDPPFGATNKQSQPTRRTQGAEVGNGGVHFRTWTNAAQVEVQIVNAQDSILRKVPMTQEGDGFYNARDSEGRPGDLYRYRLDGGPSLPDPASRYQPFGIHGPSMVVDPGSYNWKDADWRAPSLASWVIYELHVGAFTPAGTYSAVQEKLGYLKDLGVSAIELMPLAEFPGQRNWGYDGVYLYAPSHTYGTPDDLRRLVDSAHGVGLAVLLDVVYNHLGPDGNYMASFHPEYLHPHNQTPWGAGLHFEKQRVRDFFVENAPYWMREFHFDGFRLDATHAITDASEPHILVEITSAIHRNGGVAIAEDDRRLRSVVDSVDEGGLGFDACWADDFHHVLHVMLTGEKEGYYAPYKGAGEELERAISQGWFPGTAERVNGKTEKFLFCLANHDQVGNRAFGERLGHLVDAATYRAASALLCLVPQTPLIFMGGEWNTSCPFQFFTDHNDDLGPKVTAGRRWEFRHFKAFAEEAIRETIPDAQAEQTFLQSKLSWEELESAKCAPTRDLYRAFLQLRASPVYSAGREKYEVRALGRAAIVILFETPESTLAVVTDFQPALEVDAWRSFFADQEPTSWQTILSSNEARFRDPEPASTKVAETRVLVRLKH